MTTFATATDIVNTALQELGLGVVNLNAAAADATGYQMLGLLNALGDELLRANDWNLLEKTMTFTGDGVTSQFPLPLDYGRQINQTEWAVSDNRPLQGPVSPQVWSWNQYGIVSAGVYFQYRILVGQYNIFPVPGDGVEFALYYISKNWVLVNGDIFAPLSDRIVNPDDVPAFDRRLLIAGLKLKFWTAKGLDTTNLKAEFDFLLANEKAAVTGAPVISLTGNGVNPLLGWNNILDGNWNT
jgi:hypothetical protein